jgi:hypothetical protein
MSRANRGATTQILDDFVNNPGNAGTGLSEIGYPCIKLRSADEDLAAHPVVGQRPGRVAQVLPERPDAEARVARQGLERQEGIKRSADHNPLSQDATDLGRGAGQGSRIRRLWCLVPRFAQLVPFGTHASWLLGF